MKWLNVENIGHLQISIVSIDGRPSQMPREFEHKLLALACYVCNRLSKITLNLSKMMNVSRSDWASFCNLVKRIGLQNEQTSKWAWIGFAPDFQFKHRLDQIQTISVWHECKSVGFYWRFSWIVCHSKWVFIMCGQIWRHSEIVHWVDDKSQFFSFHKTSHFYRRVCRSAACNVQPIESKHGIQRQQTAIMCHANSICFSLKLHVLQIYVPNHDSPFIGWSEL